MRREFSPALLAAPATLPLRRSSGCARRWIRWEIKTGDPLSSFPIRSSVRCNALCSRRARSEECVRAYESRAPAAAEAPRRVRSRGSHIDLADGLETGSPYFHLYSPGLALSRGGSLSCSSSPLSESALICSSFSPRRFICFVPSGSRVAEVARCSVPSGDQSANPASVPGRSGLQRAFLSVSSAQKCSGAGRPATPSGVSRAARSAVPCRPPFQGTVLAALSTPEASLERLVPLVGHPAVWEPLPSVSHWDLPEQTLVPSLRP